MALQARPQGLETSAAQEELAARFGWQALEEAWLPVGVVIVPPGPAGEPQRLVLPPEWRR
jgi:hypothetical protein